MGQPDFGLIQPSPEVSLEANNSRAPNSSAEGPLESWYREFQERREEGRKKIDPGDSFSEDKGSRSSVFLADSL